MLKMITTMIRKEWAEVFKNRFVLLAVSFLPLLLVMIQLGVLYSMRGNGSVPAASDVENPLVANCPSGLTAGECAQASIINQFILMFMILPVAIPVTISASSIVGEKAARSLEPLLATPITTGELLAGKGLAAVIPAILATFFAYAIYSCGAWLLIPKGAIIAIFLEARWLIATFLVGPLLAVMAVAFSMMVSSRVNNPRVAEQISMIVVMPVIVLLFSQMAGIILVNRQVILAFAAGIAVLDIGLIYLSVRIFQREVILTRWK